MATVNHLTIRVVKIDEFDADANQKHFDYFNTEMHQCNEFVRLKLKLMQFFHSSSKVRNLRRILWVARIYAFTHASNSGRVNHDKDKVEVLHKE